MRKTDVKKHPRRTTKGRTSVKRHNRKIKGVNKNTQQNKKQFLRRKVKFQKQQYTNTDEIHQDYVDNGEYKHPFPFSTNPKNSDMEMVLELSDGSREHHRIWDEGNRWKLESHIDLVDPMKDPLGHYEKDVKAPEDNPQLRKDNFNDTQVIYLDKN